MNPAAPSVRTESRPRPAGPPGRARTASRSDLRARYRRAARLAFLLPAALYVLFAFVVPVIYNLILSFEVTTPATIASLFAPWAGISNYKVTPGVTVQRTAVSYANLITKVLQDASAGDMPNLVLLDNPNVPQVAATGQLRPLNDLPGFTTSGYYPGAISECTYQGKQYCYPIGTNSVGLFYNKAMFAAAGLQPPQTWTELASDAQKLTKAPVYGVAFDATGDEQSTWQLEPFFWSNGASLTKGGHSSVPVGPAAVGQHGQGRFGLEVRAELGPGPRPHPAVHERPRRDDRGRPVEAVLRGLRSTMMPSPPGLPVDRAGGLLTHVARGAVRVNPGSAEAGTT